MSIINSPQYKINADKFISIISLNFEISYPYIKFHKIYILKIR